MLGRALISAAVTLLIFHMATGPAAAQNLEAGKSPSQLFSATCALCHKSSRGLLKTVPPGSLPGFLRQHYTTSADMASALSSYVLSNGAADRRVGEGNLTRQGKDSRTAPKPSAEPEAKPERSSREARRPDVERLQDKPGASPAADEAPSEAAPKGRKSKQEKRKPPAAAAKGEPKAAPPSEAKPETPAAKPDSDAKTAKTDTGSPDAGKAEDGKASAAKPDASKPEAPAADSAKSDSAKPDSAKPDAKQDVAKPADSGEAGSAATRADPVPAVTPAPKETPAGGAGETPDAAAKTAEAPASNMPVFKLDEPPPPPAPAREPAGPPAAPISQ
jgi:hypothetical protein